MAFYDYLNHKTTSMRIIPVLVLFLLSLPSLVLSETIILVADDWCPYNCEPNSDSPGYIVEVAREIFMSSGYCLEYKHVPWVHALKEVMSGKYDGAIAATPKEMPGGVFPDEELGYVNNVLIICRGDPWRFQNIDSLRQIKLGAIQNYDYGKNLNTHIEKYKNTMSAQVIAGKNAIE